MLQLCISVITALSTFLRLRKWHLNYVMIWLIFHPTTFGMLWTTGQATILGFTLTYTIFLLHFASVWKAWYVITCTHASSGDLFYDAAVIWSRSHLPDCSSWPRQDPLDCPGKVSFFSWIHSTSGKPPSFHHKHKTTRYLSSWNGSGFVPSPSARRRAYPWWPRILWTHYSPLACIYSWHSGILNLLHRVVGKSWAIRDLSMSSISSDIQLPPKSTCNCACVVITVFPRGT